MIEIRAYFHKIRALFFPISEKGQGIPPPLVTRLHYMILYKYMCFRKLRVMDVGF